MIDRAQKVIVLAKQPVPGRAKTRLQQRFSPEQAADLAAAALADTLTAVRRSHARRRVLAWSGDPTAGREWSGDPTAGRQWSGDPDGAGDRFRLVDQGTGDLGERLTRVFEAELGADPTVPTLLIAMDTPQVSATLLDADWQGADAVIGLAEDGGFWGIGLRRRPAAPVFSGIEMSTDRTGAAQLARLLDLGCSVTMLPPLRDVDTPSDAAWVAEAFPALEFSERYRELVINGPEPTVVPTRMIFDAPAGMIFDQGYGGGRLVADTASGVDPLRVDLGRWQRAADGADRLVIARCQQPVLDLGCGPGRMVAELTRTGRSALGIDISRTAIAASRDRGGLALRRDLTARLPGEGRWGTVLLMDSNVGIGGDVDALLRRCAELVIPGGLIICETDCEPSTDECHQVLLSTQHTGGILAGEVHWARIGADALIRRAWQQNLIPVERWTADGRDFVALRSI